MISRLLDALNKVGLNPNGEEIADILWLALQMRISEPDRVHQDQVNQPDSQDASSSDNLGSDSEIVPPQPQFPKRTPAPVKKTTPSAPLYTNNIGTPSGEQGSLTFKTPSAPSLQEPLQLGKALRPLMRRVQSRTETVLDEVATAERIAEEKIRLAIIEVTDVETSSAVARVLEEVEGGIGIKGQIEQGAPAVILSAPVNLVRQVRLFDRKELGDAENELPTQELVNQQKDALDKVRQALAENGWVVEVQGEEEAHYQVAIGRQGEYEICIGMPIKNLNPALSIGNPEAPREVVKRLVHLAKYQAIQELDNPASELNDSLEFVLLDQNKKPLPDQSNITLKQDTVVFMRVKNNSRRALNVAVLDLEPTWEISQIPLRGIDAASYQLAPQETVDTQLRFQVPESKGYERAKVMLKLFATIGPADFRWLILPSLDKESLDKESLDKDIEGHHEATRGILSTFGKLLEAGGEDPNVSTSLSLKNRGSSYLRYDPNDDWVTKKIVITIYNTAE